MTRILRLDASARPGPGTSVGQEPSFSRSLGDAICRGLIAHKGATLQVQRDLALDPIPAISDATIKGFYTPADALTPQLRAATALSDTLIAELEAADILLITAPIYNFAVPSALKAWIDQVVRIGRTFAYEGGQFRGLVQGKRAYVAYAYGAAGYAQGGPLQAYDHMQPYLTMILNFIGIEQVASFAIEGTTADPATVAAARADALARIERQLEAEGAQ